MLIMAHAVALLLALCFCMSSAIKLADFAEDSEIVCKDLRFRDGIYYYNDSPVPDPGGVLRSGSLAAFTPVNSLPSSYNLLPNGGACPNDLNQVGHGLYLEFGKWGGWFQFAWKNGVTDVWEACGAPFFWFKTADGREVLAEGCQLLWIPGHEHP